MGLFSTKRKPESVVYKEIKIDNYLVRRKLNSFLVNEKQGFKYLITKVNVFSSNTTIRIEIETYNPGTLIGKGGVLIASMQKYLYKNLQFHAAYFEKNIKIDIKDCKLWEFSNEEEL